MPLSTSQLDALSKVRQILEEAGLPPLNDNTASKSSDAELPLLFETKSRSPSCYLPPLSYSPPNSIRFTANEVRFGLNKVTRKSCAHAIVDHPADIVLEYPETGTISGEAVAHRFKINPKSQLFVNPKNNIQYSYGDRHGGHPNVTCYLLRDIHTRDAVSCFQLKTNCKTSIIL